MKKPPAGVVIKVKRSTLSGMMVMPNQLPAPMISRIEPITTRVRVKPRPMPRPSMAESSTLFFEANISARPRMMQFTTISGRNTPSALSSAGT